VAPASRTNELNGQVAGDLADPGSLTAATAGYDRVTTPTPIGELC